jgi:hypothetical protein
MDQRNEAQDIAKRINDLAKAEVKRLMVMQNEVETIQMRIEARLEFMDHLHRLAVRLEELYQESLRDKRDAH